MFLLIIWKFHIMYFPVLPGPPLTLMISPKTEEEEEEKEKKEEEEEKEEKKEEEEGQKKKPYIFRPLSRLAFTNLPLRLPAPATAETTQGNTAFSSTCCYDFIFTAVVRSISVTSQPGHLK